MRLRGVNWFVADNTASDRPRIGVQVSLSTKSKVSVGHLTMPLGVLCPTA